MIIFYDQEFSLHDGICADFVGNLVFMRNFGVLPLEFCPECGHVTND